MRCVLTTDTDQLTILLSPLIRLQWPCGLQVCFSISVSLVTSQSDCMQEISLFASARRAASQSPDVICSVQLCSFLGHAFLMQNHTCAHGVKVFHRSDMQGSGTGSCSSSVVHHTHLCHLFLEKGCRKPQQRCRLEVCFQSLLCASLL